MIIDLFSFVSVNIRRELLSPAAAKTHSLLQVDFSFILQLIICVSRDPQKLQRYLRHYWELAVVFPTR